MKELYSESFKIVMKEIGNDTNKLIDILCSGLEELILLKYPSIVDYKAICRFKEILIKILVFFSPTELE